MSKLAEYMQDIGTVNMVYIPYIFMNSMYKCSTGSLSVVVGSAIYS